MLALELDKPFITTYVDEEGAAYVNCTWKPVATTGDVSYVITWYDADVLDVMLPILVGPALRLGADVFAGTTVRRAEGSRKRIGEQRSHCHI